MGEKQGFIKLISKNKILLLMATPAILYFLLFSYVPMTGLVLAFKQYNFRDGIFGSPWNGLENIRFLLNTGVLIDLTKHNLFFNTLFLFTGMTCQIITAIFIAEMSGKHFKKIAQSATLFPFFISWVIVSALIYNIFNYEYGVLNNILKSIGKAPVDIYGYEDIWKYILVFLNMWKWVGYGAVIYLAAIMGIDSSLYESAYLDGANIFQKITKITIPMIIPTITVMFLMNVGQLIHGHFDMFYQITANNPVIRNSTDIIETYIYRAISGNTTGASSSNDIGIATAIGFYQSLLGLVLILTTNKLVKMYNKENALF